MSEKTAVEKVKRRILELEQAIQRLDFVKRHLNQNSSEIKTQIHTSISRHLETLRNREVWLLDQVDAVLVGKEDVLQQQQARLNKALGVLHSSLAHVTDSEDGSAIRHLAQALEELTTIELKAEETPYIAFRADQVSLRESITSYGRVDPNGMPLISAFADVDEPSASLPRHVEEYEDSDHHLFYKALQDGKGSGSSIQVIMPKLSSRVKDWLQQPVLELSTCASQVKMTSSDSVGTPVSQTTCAIQNWLAEIKHNPDGEDEDDFEIVDHSGSSQRESPMEEEMKPMQPSEPWGFAQVFRHSSQDIRRWLHKGNDAGSAATGEEELYAFFRHIPRDTNMWLATARQQLKTLDDLKQGGWFRHIPTEPSTWLRRAHDKRSSSTQPAIPDMFAHITRDKNAWLKKSSPPAEEPQSQGDRGSLKSGEEGRDGLLAKLSSPLAPSPSATGPAQGCAVTSPAAMDCWLLRQEDRGAAASGLSAETGPGNLPDTERYLKKSSYPTTWLAGPKGDVEPDSAVYTTSFFPHISTNLVDWLHVKNAWGGPLSLTPNKGGKKQPTEDHRQWLHPESTAANQKSGMTPLSPLSKMQATHSGMSTSDWLHGCADTPSDASWKIVSESSQSSGSPRESFVTSGHQIPSLDVAAWICQKQF